MVPHSVPLSWSRSSNSQPPGSKCRCQSSRIKLPILSCCRNSPNYSLFRYLNTLRNNRFDIENCFQQILHNFVCSLFARLLDLLDLVLSILICVFFSLLVSACMLYPNQISTVLVLPDTRLCRVFQLRLPSMTYLRLELLELLVFGLLVRINLFLRLVSCLLYTLCTV